MGLLVKLFIEETKREVSIGIYESKDDRTPEKTILDVIIPWSNQNDSSNANVSDIDECTNNDLAEETRNDVKSIVCNMETDHENISSTLEAADNNNVDEVMEQEINENNENDHISICDSVDYDVKPIVLTSDNEVNARSQNSRLVIAEVHSENVEMGACPNESTASGSRIEESGISNDSDLHEITFVDSETNEENVEENSGTNPLETTNVNTIASEATNENVDSNHNVGNNLSENVNNDLSEELELEINVADDDLEMSELDTSDPFSQETTEKNKTIRETGNHSENRLFRNPTESSVVDLTDERDCEQISSTSRGPDDILFLNRRNNPPTLSSRNDPIEITLDDDAEDFDGEFSENDYAGSDDEDLEFSKFRRNSPCYWQDENVHFFDKDSAYVGRPCENENGPLRRGSDVQVVDLTNDTDKEKRNQNKNSQVCIDLTSERDVRRSNDEIYTPSFVPAKRNFNDVMRDIRNFYIGNKSLIDETQEALVNFEPKSPEPRDNDWKFNPNLFQDAPWTKMPKFETRSPFLQNTVHFRGNSRGYFRSRYNHRHRFRRGARGRRPQQMVPQTRLRGITHRGRMWMR